MPSKTLYIGNLYCMVNKDQLRNLCSQYGTVRSITMVEGTGYAYVEMKDVVEAEQARRALDGVEFLQRVLRVKEASSTVPFTNKEVKRIIK